MITYDPKSWRAMIFRIAKSDTLRMLRKELLFIFTFTIILAYVELNLFPVKTISVLEKLFSFYQLLGFVISLLLVFRTNTAYDRWWEGRRMWGQLVNDSRNLAVKIAAMGLDKESNTFFARHIANFPLVCKEHLREGTKFELLDLTPEEIEFLQHVDHIPSGIVELIWLKLNQLKKEGKITEEDLIRIDRNLNGFLDVIGACERIKNTPIPYSYSMFFKKFIFIYVVTLPLAFIPNFSYFSALMATFIYYVFVSIEVIAEEIEDPFGSDENDLPTDKMAERIAGVVTTIMLKKAGNPVTGE